MISPKKLYGFILFSMFLIFFYSCAPSKETVERDKSGKPGEKEDLPDDLKDKEAPSDRKKVSDIIFNGKFKGD